MNEDTIKMLEQDAKTLQELADKSVIKNNRYTKDTEKLLLIKGHINGILNYYRKGGQ